MRVLAIAGSVRSDSHNRRLLRFAQRAAVAGVEIELLDQQILKSIPAFDEDDEATPPAEVAEFRDAIARADALLFATPEYNSSIPGALKNALDWASRPNGSSVLWGKPVAVIGASPGRFGAVWAQAELRKVLAASGSRVIQSELSVGVAHEAFDADGDLIDPTQIEALQLVVADLAVQVNFDHERPLAA